MKPAEKPPQGRRAFIKTCLRIGAGTGLLIGGAVLGFRDNDNASTQEACQLKIPCKGCNKFNGCSFSRAQTIKNSARGSGGFRAGS